VSQPPSVGPNTEAMPHAPEKTPWYLPRSAGEKMSPTIANVNPIMMPPQIPCIARNRMSWFIPSSLIDVNLPAAPHNAEVNTKPAEPPSRNHFRP